MNDWHPVTLLVDTGAHILISDSWLTHSICPEGSHHVDMVEISQTHMQYPISKVKLFYLWP